MKILKKRSVAIIIVLIIAIVFTFIGVRLSVNRQAQKVEDMFYTGVDGETGLQTYLDNVFKESKVLYSIADEYLDSEVTKSFRVAYNNLYEAETISEKYQCNETLKEELDKLLLIMEGEWKYDFDQVYLASHVDTMENVQQMIASSSYNEKVQEFEDTVLNIFPVSLFKSILGLEAPEYFA